MIYVIPQLHLWNAPNGELCGRTSILHIFAFGMDHFTAYALLTNCDFKVCPSFAKIGVSRKNTILFIVVSVHTFTKMGVSYPISVVYIRISSLVSVYFEIA